jgi:alpha-1,2-mannosyltransferase
VSLRRFPLALCAAVYGVSIAALLVSHLGHGWGYVDLAIYRDGGEAVAHGARLYALRFPGALAFTYPPFSALLFTGLTVPSPELTRALLTALSLLLVPVMLGFALRLRPLNAELSRGRALRLALLASALAVWLEPVWTTLRYGQIDLLIGALVFYDLSRPDGARWKGAALGVAVAIKLTPAIFALYLLLSRRVRAAAVCGAVFVSSVVLGFALIPGDSSAYWGGAFLDSGRVGRIENAANQSLRGTFARLAHSGDVQLLWLCSATLVALGGLALAVRAGRRGDDARGVSLCALTGLLVSPISWSHHWVLAVPALMLLALDARKRRSGALLAAAGVAALVALLHVIWWVPVNRPRHSELHLGAAQLLYADAYVLLAILALALAGTWELRTAGRVALTGQRLRPRGGLRESGVRAG